MILYAGNILSEYGYTPTFIELLTPKLSERYEIKAVSNKKNQIVRMLDMINNLLINKSKIKLLLIDSYSRRAFWYTYILAKLAHHFKIPYIPILRGGGYPERIIQSPGKCNFIFSNSQKNISPSLYLKTKFEEKGYDVDYIPNFIPVCKYVFKLRDFLKPKLLWVRSFHEIYNPLLAVEILKELKVKHPEAELCMVGPDKDGTLREVEEKAKKLNVINSLKLTGKLSKKEWINLSVNYDIFINTTNFDNHPVSVIEAMALGLPVISTNVGGIPYLIENNVNGLLVPPNDPGVFIRAINKILENNEFSKKMTNRAREMVERFDWDVIKYKWFDTIDCVLNTNKS